MLLATLIFELRALLDDPEHNLAAITALLREHDDFAEYEVARHYVAAGLEPLIRKRMDDPDPGVRKTAILALRQTFSRPAAAKLLRHLVKDPSRSVRGAARRAVRELGIDDVALRDPSRPKPRHPRRGLGGWNPNGWFAGTGSHRRRPRLVAASVRAQLPTLETVDALARWLGYASASDLRRFMRPGSERGAPYVEFEIAKARGGRRTICAPRAPLRAIQRQLNREILAKVELHPAAHGFVAGRSIVTNAEVHVGAALLIKTDIREFFPTLHYFRIRGLFAGLGYGEAVSGALAGLCSRRAVLDGDPHPDGDRRIAWPGLMPQGAPTSPALANLACRGLDARLTGLAARVGARYTRYADDLSISFPDPAAARAVDVGRLFWWIDQILQQEGFAEHYGKRQVLRPHARQLVAGIVVNERLSVPRAARRRFRAILHNIERHGLASQARGRDDFADYLRGYAAYVSMVQPDLGARWVARVDALLANA